MEIGLGLPEGYPELLSEIKGRIRDERVRVICTANAAMVLLYWDIGQSILSRQRHSGWGARIVDQLARDFRGAFPDMQGFSPRNLKYMRAFAVAWPERAIVQQVAAQLPWAHNCLLLDKLADVDLRSWYAQIALEQGWSRSILGLQIEARLHRRQGRAITNFQKTLPPVDSEMAAQVFKDPYLFDLLETADPRRESEIEDSLVAHLQQFLLELGAGFAFVGRQVLLDIGGQEFRLDLLFYHLRLRCYVVVELKAVPFDPAFIGQMNVYLSAVDDQRRHSEDGPTIGLLLCRSKNSVVVEYAIRDFAKPIGVAEWETRLVAELPERFRGALPTVSEIERELRPSGRRIR